ncbi:hypothetical protein GGI20_001126 [Coemansia sp. BCRC 34301]|nr:hypothetical protein GGI20_001126 [Coemansia sp. BCRC 34301]
MLQDGNSSRSGGEQATAHSGSSNLAPKTPNKPAQSHVLAASHKSTPQIAPAAGTYHEHPLPLSERRGALARTLKVPLKDLKFESLVTRLGLKNTFAEYKAASTNVFTHIMDSITIPVCPAKSKEELYVEDFLEMIRSLRKFMKTTKTVPEQYRRSPYKPFDHQKKIVPGSALKPDVMFASSINGPPTIRDPYLFLEAKPFDSKPDAYRSYAPQMADYVMALREFQPTRTFVPILFLNGCYLELLVFVHSGYYRAFIGQVLHEDNDEDDMESVSLTIANSLQCLWFLLTLPADKFGFLFDSQRIPTNLKVDMTMIPATLEAVDDDSDDVVVRVGDPITYSVQIIGRCAYLLNAEYKGKAVVLKLSWTRTNRLPEGAVYRVLERHGVSNIPEILASGILVKDLFGYRLEFLVMEHCGTPIVSYFQSLPKSPEVVSDLATEAAHYVEQVTRTLTEALEIGILHRDISAGNIAIKGGKAYVIDWGYAKFLRQPGNDEFAADIATRWDFDWNTVLEIESAKDPFTGTPLYMSCRLLLGAKKRSIYDDFESLLYVMLDAFSNRPRASNLGEQPAGFQFFSSKTTALTRLSCMLSSKHFLKLFGVNLDKASAVIKMLDTMRQFLFFDIGAHVVDRVLDDTDFPRTLDSEAARGFMSEATISKLVGLVGENVAQSPLPLDTATPASRERVPACLPGSALPTEPTLDLAQHNTGDGSDIVDVGTSRGLAKLKLGTGAFPVSPSPAARNDSLVRGEARCSLHSPLRKMSRPLVFNPGAEDPKGKRVDTTIGDMDNFAMETESDSTQGSSSSNSPSGSKVSGKGSKKAILPGISPVLTRSRSKISQSRSNSAAKENDAPTANLPDKSNVAAKGTKRASRANANSSTRKPAKRTKR